MHDTDVAFGHHGVIPTIHLVRPQPWQELAPPPKNPFSAPPQVCEREMTGMLDNGYWFLRKDSVAVT